MTLEVHGHVAEAAREAIEIATASHRTLEDVIQWALAQRPPARIEDVLKQDEYTQDVLVASADGLYLVYDTT
jgi:microcompartment protein CcmL/EutN